LNKQGKHIIHFPALALALLLLFAFGAKEVHHFWAHAHVEVKICDANENEKHWHDEEYSHADCNLCDFTFSIFDFSLPSFSLNHKDILEEKTDFFFIKSHYSHAFFYTKGRAPPTFLLS
jgi:hypothetical protein